MKTSLLYVLDPGAKAPVRNTPTDSGLDFFALDRVEIKPGEVVLVKTGVRVKVIPVEDNGYTEPGFNTDWTLGCFVWDKSGRGLRGLKTLGGVIDNGYRDEVGIIISYIPVWMLFVQLFSDRLAAFLAKGLAVSPFVIDAGEKVAQLVVQRVELPELVIVSDEEYRTYDSARGVKGYGSSGLK